MLYDENYIEGSGGQQHLESSGNRTSQFQPRKLSAKQGGDWFHFKVTQLGISPSTSTSLRADTPTTMIYLI